MSAGPRSPIADYALIGNCRSGALVSKSGAIDWLCWPRFDSPATFAALLDPEKGGAWSLRPLGDFTVTREYVPGTAVLRTTFSNHSATVTISDAMVITSPAHVKKQLSPENEIVRVVTCTRGTANLETCFDPRPNFGKRAPRLIDRGKLGIRVEDAGGCSRCFSSFSIWRWAERLRGRRTAARRFRLS